MLRQSMLGGQTIVANRWQGEAECWVGPFSSREVAQTFADFVVNVGDAGICAGEIRAVGDSWFLEVAALKGSSPAVPVRGSSAPKLN